MAKITIVTDGRVFWIKKGTAYWQGPNKPYNAQWLEPNKPDEEVPCWMTTSLESAKTQAALFRALEDKETVLPPFERLFKYHEGKVVFYNAMNIGSTTELEKELCALHTELREVYRAIAYPPMY